MKEEHRDNFLTPAGDDTVHVVAHATIGRGFWAGDVKTMGQITAKTVMERLRRAHRVIAALANIEKPVIAAVRGPVTRIGESLALACDVIVASEAAVFSQVFKNVGLIPEGGAVYFLSQHLGPIRTNDMVMTARKVPAIDAGILASATRWSMAFPVFAGQAWTGTELLRRSRERHQSWSRSIIILGPTRTAGP
jgi:2-(1,2-epoxy-1,2-dihydrophenyl)acetyl-CoA isomerase